MRATERRRRVDSFPCTRWKLNQRPPPVHASPRRNMEHASTRGVIGSLVLAAALAVGLAACGGSGNSGRSDNSSSIAQSIRNNGASQMQATVSSLGGGTVKMQDANCVQTAGTQTYSCIAHYSYKDPSGAIYSYALNDISGTCDNSGTCQWHSNGPGSLTGAQPARPPEGSTCTPRWRRSGHDRVAQLRQRVRLRAPAPIGLPVRRAISNRPALGSWSRRHGERCRATGRWPRRF